MPDDIRNLTFNRGDVLTAANLQTIVDAVVNIMRGSPELLAPAGPMLVKAQEEIASGASGSVKRAWYEDGALTVSPAGEAEFTAINAGSVTIPEGGAALCDNSAGSTPFLMYSAGGSDLAGNTSSIVDAETATSGTAATFMRSDAKPGNKLVGAPGDATDDTATLYASLEYVKKTDGTRRGQRARLSASYTATKQPLGVDASGLYAKVSNTAGQVLDVDDAGIYYDGTPKTHASTHQSGGTDAIKLDDLATPDDNTDLNASTNKHGLLPKLGGGTTNFLRADGTWAAPGGSSSLTHYESTYGGSDITVGGNSSETYLQLTLPAGTWIVDVSALINGTAQWHMTMSGGTIVGGYAEASWGSSDDRTLAAAAMVTVDGETTTTITVYCDNYLGGTVKAEAGSFYRAVKIA